MSELKSGKRASDEAVLITRTQQSSCWVVCEIGSLKFLDVRQKVLRYEGRVSLWSWAWFPQLLDDPLEVEFVGVALAVGLGKDQLVVVVAQRPRQLVVCHARLLFPLTPLPSHFVWVHHTELAIAALPGDAVTVWFVVEQREQKLPQLDLTSWNDREREPCDLNWPSVFVALVIPVQFVTQFVYFEILMQNNSCHRSHLLSNGRDDRRY